MKFCTEHWTRLREAIDARGLTPLVARNDHDAHTRAVEEIKGEADESSFDPLMAAHNMIVGHVAKGAGLYLFTGDFCPVCEFCKNVEPPPSGHRYANNETYLIDGPSDAILANVKSSPVLCAMLGWGVDADTTKEAP